MAQLQVEQAIEIEARPESVWRMLTEPELTVKYMYGCRALTDWKPGSPLLWEGVLEGRAVVFVKGTVLAAEAPRLLRYSVFDPNSNYRDVPDNYLQVTCRLTPRQGGVRLEVVTGDFSTVENGQQRYEHTLSGGDGLLQQMKAVAEAL